MVRFGGILFIVGKPSTVPPFVESDNLTSPPRRVVMNYETVQKAIKQIIGKPLWYNVHDQTRPAIGLIEKAEIIGDMFYIEGPLFNKQNCLDMISLNTCEETLGLSFDTISGSNSIEDINSSIWVINKSELAGATVLPQRRASYRKDTLFWIEESKDERETSFKKM